jgi:hypothetical protein
MTTEPALAPICVSQETCLAAYGVSPRWYLERANAGAFRSWRVGKLVLSLPADFLAFLASQPSGARESGDLLPDVLSELGLGRRAG